MNVNKNILKSIGLVSAGVAAGSTCTYFSVRGHLKKKFEARSDDEIESVKRTYALLRKEGPYSDPATALKEYQGRVEELEYATAEATVAAEEQLAEDTVQERADQQKELLRNIFDDSHADLVATALAEEDHGTLEQILSMKEAEKIDGRDPDAFDALSTRDPYEPFHVPKDDYFDDSNEFEKLTVTYYEGDDVLTDDQEKIIQDVDGVIGRPNLSRFGQASDDVNIVYVRNERLRSDFEVIRDPREYTEVVLGIKSDPSEMARRIRRMRNDE